MIDVNNETDAAIDEVEFAELAQYVLREMNIAEGAELAILFVDEPAMEQLHIQWMDEPGSTDVLSFPSDERGFLGDIVIAAGVSTRQAREAGHTAQTELRVLALHGLLHLLGYDHEEDDGKMARAEMRLRKKAGLKEGLIERQQ